MKSSSKIKLERFIVKACLSIFIAVLLTVALPFTLRAFTEIKIVNLSEKINGLGTSGENAIAILNKSLISIGAESGQSKPLYDLGQVIKRASIDNTGSRIFLTPDNEKQIYIVGLKNGTLVGKIDAEEKDAAFCIDSISNTAYIMQQSKGIIDVLNLSDMTKANQIIYKEKTSHLLCYGEKNMLLAVAQNEKNINGILQVIDGAGVLKDKYVFDKKIKAVSIDRQAGNAAILTWDGIVYKLDINNNVLIKTSYLNKNTGDIELRGDKILATDTVSGDLFLVDSSSGAILEKAYIGANAEHIACTETYCFVSFKNGVKILKDESLVSKIELNIAFPPNNESISKPYTLVTGTVNNSAGNETGVTVNGVVAVVYGNQFFVNHLPLVEGENTITVNAVDISGNRSASTITVYADTTKPHITLNSNIESGISPLDAYFSVDTAIPNSVSTYQMDGNYEGNFDPDYTGAAFDGVSFTYAYEGVYYPMILVTDSAGNGYTDTIAVVVQNKVELDALLQGKWEGMRTALVRQDVDGAIEYFVDRSKVKYRNIFEALKEQMPFIMGTFIEFNIINVYENMAEYEVVADENGVLYSYPGTLIKDANGIWKFKDF